MKGLLIALGGLVLLGFGVTLMRRTVLGGIILLILGLLVFVISFASSLPQSTEHARDD